MTIISVLNESIMLLGGTVGKWMEPVGIMGCTSFDCPDFEPEGDLVSLLPGQRFSFIHCSLYNLECIFRQVMFHFVKIEDIYPERFLFSQNLMLQAFQAAAYEIHLKPGDI